MIIKRILILIALLPFLEILILIRMGEIFGFWKTILVIIGTGFLGALIARFEGFRAIKNFHKAIQAGEMPAEHLMDAAIVFVAGVLLAIPGLISDLIGLFLLIPWTRYLFKRWLRKKFDQMIKSYPSGNIQYRFLIR